MPEQPAPKLSVVLSDVCSCNGLDVRHVVTVPETSIGSTPQRRIHSRLSLVWLCFLFLLCKCQAFGGTHLPLVRFIGKGHWQNGAVHPVEHSCRTTYTSVSTLPDSNKDLTPRGLSGPSVETRLSVETSNGSMMEETATIALSSRSRDSLATPHPRRLAASGFASAVDSSMVGKPPSPGTSHCCPQAADIHPALLPGTTLLQPTPSEIRAKSSDPVTIRVARDTDHLDIVRIRYSTYPEMSDEERLAYYSCCFRYIQERQEVGSICLVATMPRDTRSVVQGPSEIVVGAAECSFFEFEGTQLGEQSRENSLMYVTAVVVDSAMRKRGIGRKIMASIDCIAQIRGVETAFLHAEANNPASHALYGRAGYTQVPPDDLVFQEFTKSLDLDGKLSTEQKPLKLLFKRFF